MASTAPNVDAGRTFLEQLAATTGRVCRRRGIRRPAAHSRIPDTTRPGSSEKPAHQNSTADFQYSMRQ